MLFRRIVVCLCLSCFAFPAFGLISLHVSVIHKRGIDKDLVLVSEFHKIQEIVDDESVVLKMKDNLKIELIAEFAQELKDYGPSPLVHVRGKIWSGQKKSIFLGAIDTLIRLDEKKTISHKSNDELIEIIIHPGVP